MSMTGQLDSQNSILVGVQFKIDNLKKAFAPALAQLRTTGAQIKTAQASIQSAQGHSWKAIGLEAQKSLGLPMEMYEKDKKKMMKTMGSKKRMLRALSQAYATNNAKIKTTNAQVATSMVPLNAKLNESKTNIKKISNEMNKGIPKFKGWALSIMFLGMAMLRIFSGIWKSASKTFREVSDSVEGSTNGFAMLEGSVKFLQYALGAAFEPVAMWLIPIVDTVSNWVSENEELTRVLTLIVGILGGFLMVLGTITLGIDGLVGMYASWHKWIGKIIKSKAGKAVIEGLGAAFKTVKGWAGKALTKATEFLHLGKKGSAGMQAFGVASLVVALIAVIYLLTKFADYMGGWDKLFINAARGAMTAFGWLVSGVGAGIEWVIGRAVNMWAALTGEGAQVNMSFMDHFNSNLDDIKKKVDDVFGPQEQSVSPGDFFTGIADSVKADFAALKNIGGGDTVINNNYNLVQLEGESDLSFAERIADAKERYE